MLHSRKEIIFVVLAGIFITSAIVAELISCKQIDTNRIVSAIVPGDRHFNAFLPMIAGILPWPIVFLLTDVMNEFFGKKALRRLSWITCGMIIFCFLIVFFSVILPTDPKSFATDTEYTKLFGGSLPIMIGSVVAFILSQMIDVWGFWFMRRLTGERLIWLRSTGSTAISQLVDSYTVLLIGFWLPGKMSLEMVLYVGIMNYVIKLMIAILLTPLIYAVRGLIRKILGEKEAEALAQAAAAESLPREAEDR